MTLSWLSVNANNGSVIADLPNVQTQGSLKQTLMQYQTQTATLPLKEAPPNWRIATRKGAAFLVALDEEEQPLWGGLVNRRVRKVGAGVEMNLITAEGYLDRVFVGDEHYVLPQNLIVKALVEKYAATTPELRGIPIRVEIVGGEGVVRDQAYGEAQRLTLYRALTGFSGLLGGPEWTIGWEWIDGRTLGLVFYVGDRIGSPAPAGLLPAAQFYMPGDVTAAELVEGYGADEGANDVQAFSTGTDAAVPQSPKQQANEDFRPRFEYRWSPGTDISDVTELTSHAQRALGAMKDGAVGLSLTATRSEAPQLNHDWRIGDDIGFDITATEFPGGLTGTARAVGWELTDTTITPLIDVTDVEGVD